MERIEDGAGSGFNECGSSRSDELQGYVSEDDVPRLVANSYNDGWKGKWISNDCWIGGEWVVLSP